MPAPNCKLKTLLKLQDKLYKALLYSPYYKETISLIVDDLAKYISEYFSSSGPDCLKTIEDIIEQFPPATNLDEDACKALAQKCAGFSEAICAGKKPVFWPESGAATCWAALSITAVEEAFEDKPRYRTKFRVIEGPGTGFAFDKTLSKKHCRYLLSEIGYKYQSYEKDVHDLYGLYMIALLEQDGSRINFKHVTASPSQKSYNRDLLKRREQKCIKGITDKCKYCPLGIEDCELARHEKTFEYKTCVCTYPKKHKGYIEKLGYCMNCIRKKHFRIKQ